MMTGTRELAGISTEAFEAGVKAVFPYVTALESRTMTRTREAGAYTVEVPKSKAQMGRDVEALRVAREVAAAAIAPAKSPAELKYVASELQNEAYRRFHAGRKG